MVYGAEAVLPCNIVHDSPRVRMYEDREAELDRQDDLDGLEEERDVAKAHSAFYQQQARRYQSREVRAKTYNVGELVLCLPEKKKDKLKPKWEGPCQCQNRRISGRGSRTVRLRRMVTAGGGHDVYPGSGPLDGGKTLRPA